MYCFNEINPANGLPMIDDVIDINGNPYGTDDDLFSNDDDLFSNDDDLFSNDDF